MGQLEGEVESSMSLICKYYSKIVHNQEKYSTVVDRYKLPSSLSSGHSVKKSLRFNESINVEEEKRGSSSSSSSSESSPKHH
jgi:hypothetical protein